MRRQLSRAVQSNVQPEIPSGPSIVYDDTSGTSALSARGGQRRRERLLVTEEAVDQALQLAHEGKVNAKNAWDVQLIEGMQGTIETCMEGQQREDQYAQFTKAANIVESGAKVWTHRVESTYTLSNQVYRRLIRTDGKADKEDDGAGGEGADSTTQTAKAAKKKKNLERTIAETMDEINMTKAVQTCRIDPMFRAMTEKFDQGNSGGLLMNNAPIGRFGNLILDADAVEYGGVSGGAAGSTPAIVADQAGARDLEIAFAPGQARGSTNSATADASPKTGQRTSTGGSSQQAADNHVTDLPHMGVPLQAPEAIAPTGDAVPASASYYDDDDDGGNDTGGDFAAYDDADYDDDGDGPEADEGGQPPQALEAMVNDMLDPAAQLEHLDHAMKEQAERGSLMVDDQYGWVPMSQHIGRGIGAMQHTSAMLSSIRRQCVVKAGRGQDGEGAKATKRQTKVRFLETNATQGSSEGGGTETQPDPLSAIKVNKTEFSSTMPTARQLFSTKSKTSIAPYKQEGHCMARAVNNKLILPRRPADALDWLPTNIADINGYYFQPFSCSDEWWNWSRARRGGAAGRGEEEEATRGALAPRVSGQIVRPGEEAFGEEVIEDMAVAFDDNDGDDGDDLGNALAYGDDAGGVANQDDNTLFQVMALGANMELPDIQVDDGAPGAAVTGAADQSDAVDLIAKPEDLNVLKLNVATVPTQVDVVKLRSCMWENAQALTAKAAAESAAETDVTTSRKQRQGNKRQRENDLTEEDHQEAPATQFTDIVASMLPRVKTFAGDGALSPAFFFFSLLFLTNEHSLTLQSADDLSDVSVCCE